MTDYKLMPKQITEEMADAFWEEYSKSRTDDLLMRCYKAMYAVAPQSADRQPELVKYQPCGCVICTCEHETQCQGCGAEHCGTHPVGQLPEPIYQQTAVQDKPVGYVRPHHLKMLRSGKVCGITLEDTLDTHNRVTAPLFAAPQPSAGEVPEITATFECESNGITGSTSVPVKRINRHDDGVIEVILDYWPTPPPSPLPPPKRLPREGGGQ